MIKLSRMHPLKLSILSSIHGWSLHPPGRCHQRERPSELQFEKVLANPEAVIAPSGQSWEGLCTASVCINQ